MSRKSCEACLPILIVLALVQFVAILPSLSNYTQHQIYYLNHPLKEEAEEISYAANFLPSNAREEELYDNDSRQDKESSSRRKGNNDNSTSNTNDSLDVNFFGNDMEEQQHCMLSAESITFLACGADGHAFSAIMTCSSNSPPNRTIVLKGLHSELSSKNQVPFISNNSTEEEELYNALFTNTTHNERRRFAISIGTANITPKLLMNAVIHHNESSPFQTRERCLRVLPSSFSDDARIKQPDYETTPVIAHVYSFAQGERMEPHELITKDERRHVAAELVCIYQHMYHRKILHEDISTSHLLYNAGKKGAAVILVDFNRAKIYANKKKNKHAKEEERERQVQQLQLMTLIANVCTQSRGDTNFPVPNRASNVKKYLERLGHMKHNLTIAMEQCSLSNQPSLASDLLENNYTIEETYEIFDKWSGGCEQ